MLQEEYDQYLAQSALQSEAAAAQKQLYAPQLREEVQRQEAILVNQTNPDRVVRKIILYLEGKEEVDGKIVRWGQPKLNPFGIEQIRYILTSYVNQGTILSHHNEQQIAKMMEVISEDLVDDLSLNWRAWGIKNKTDLDVINDSVLIAIFSAFNRSLEQNEKNWLGRITVESLNSGGQKIHPPKDGGWLSKFKL